MKDVFQRLNEHANEVERKFSEPNIFRLSLVMTFKVVGFLEVVVHIFLRTKCVLGFIYLRRFFLRT